MKQSASKLTLFCSALAVSCLFSVPAVRAGVDAADPKADKKAEAKAKHDAEVLKKYDKNGNGVLDPDELAAKQANDDKMKALRDAKKRKAEERAKAGQGDAKPSARS